jgi:hypothetical protein
MVINTTPTKLNTCINLILLYFGDAEGGADDAEEVGEAVADGASLEDDETAIM